MDTELVVKAQQGDERAFEALAAGAYARLLRLAHGILRDQAKADDATQEALVNVWRNLPRLRDPAKFEGWCCRLLVNACHDQVRRAPRWVTDAALPASHEPTAHDDFAPVADRDALERALSCVSLEQRTILALRYLLDLTPDEVAAALGIPRKTVYSRLHRAVESLRAAMEAEARPVVVGIVPGEAVR
jgi:RNA polymerase sigma-70 factor (ECF subfamily)